MFLRFRGQSAKNTCLRFAIFNFSEKLQNIFEIGLRKCELIVQKSLLKKKCFEIKNSETRFCCLYAKLATVKIWEQSNKFPLTCSSLKCPLLVKKLFRENSAEKIFLLSKQTPPTNSQLGSQIAEPISAWKVYFRWLPGEISPRNLSLHFRRGSKFEIRNLNAGFFGRESSQQFKWNYSITREYNKC